MGETVLDRRTHTCKGPEGGLTHPRGIKKGCVASAQNLRERGEVLGEWGGRWATFWLWGLPAMVDNPLTTTKAQACPIRTDTSHRLKQGPGAPHFPSCWIWRRSGGPREEVVGAA